MNLLSDKIALLYGYLNDIKVVESVELWSYTGSTIKICDFAHIGTDGRLYINLTPSLKMNNQDLITLDTETGGAIEHFSYREMLEEEFFQLSTVVDFGPCDYDDIKFTNRHIDALCTLGGEFALKVRARIIDLQEMLSQDFARTIQQEIDAEINAEILKHMTESLIKPTMKSNFQSLIHNTTKMTQGVNYHGKI